MRSGRRGAVALAVAVLCLSEVLVAAPSAGAGSEPTVPIVVVGDTTISAAAVAAATGGTGEITRTVAAIGSTVVEVPASRANAAMARLDALGGVDSATVVQRATAFDVTPNDPQWFRQDSLRSVGVPAAWSASTGSSSTVIAIVDSGVDEAADLAGRVLPGYDFVNGDTDPADDAGHGTDAALVAAAAGNDAAGAAGLCWTCRVLPVKVLDSDGSGLMSDVAAGIVFATDNGADIINLSLGGRFADPSVTQAVDYAIAHDVVIVASAGNEGGTYPNYPAADVGVISVAGSRTDVAQLWSWSQRGPTWVDLAAPGCNWVVDDEGLYNFCGTSSAAPLVAGLAALLRSLRPSADRQMVETALVSTADFGSMRGYVGYGVVNAAAAAAVMPSVLPGAPPLPTDVTGPDVGLDLRPGYQSGVVPVRVLSSDDQRVASAEVWVDGARVAEVASPPGAVDVAFDTRTTGDGAHTVFAVAVDGVGQRTTGVADTMLVDNVNPLGLLTSPTSGARVTGPFVARVFVTDPNGIMGTFLIANDQVIGGFQGAGWGQATVPVTRSGPIRVVAITVDNAGRISGTNTAVVQASVAKRRTRR